MIRVIGQLFTGNKFKRLYSYYLQTQFMQVMSMENIEVSRVMMPDDANIAGNVHGGTLLKMIEEAGVIIATRHCNEGTFIQHCKLAVLAT